jgi:hypothetical protein
MGVVYRALDPETQREVALKLLLTRAPSETKLKRFRREAQALARVRDPHVVGIHSVGEDERGRPYMVMELIQGESLLDRVGRTGRLPAREAARLALGIAQGLEALHEQGIVHRDVKPENVVVGADGRPRLTDFGLVRDLDAGLEATQLSTTGVYMGSPGYWPPEQARGQHDQVDARSDVFALGATLFHLLTGESPQDGETLAQALDKLFRSPPAPSSVQPDVPRDLDAVVLACLARDPARRYPSAAALAADLQAYLDGAPVGVVASKRRRMVRVASGSLAAVGLAVGLGVVAAALGERAPVEPPPPTESPGGASSATAPPLAAAARALQRDPSSGSLAAFERMLLQAFDPAALPAEVAAALDALDAVEPHQRLARALVAGAAAPHQDLARAWDGLRRCDLAEREDLLSQDLLFLVERWEALEPDWEVRKGTTLTDQGTTRDPYLDRAAELLAWFLDHDPADAPAATSWRLVYQRVQRGVVDELLAGGLRLAASYRPHEVNPGLDAHVLDRLIAYEPTGVAARRLGLLRWAEFTGTQPPAQHESEPSRLLSYLQLLANLERGRAPLPADLISRLEDLPVQRWSSDNPGWLREDAQSKLWLTALRKAIGSLVCHAYTQCLARGSPLKDLSVYHERLVEGFELLARWRDDAEPQLEVAFRGCLQLLGPEPERALELSDSLAMEMQGTAHVLRAETLLVLGRYEEIPHSVNLRGLALDGVTIEPLLRHLETLTGGAMSADLGPGLEGGRGAEVQGYPWHQQPYVEDVIAGRTWWPGAAR